MASEMRPQDIESADQNKSLLMNGGGPFLPAPMMSPHHPMASSPTPYSPLMALGEKSNGFHGSAFAPPTKMDPPPTIKQEVQETSRTPTPEEGRSLRKAAKRKATGEQCCCPVCGVTIRQNDFHSHLQIELERVNNIQSRPTRGCTRQSSSPGCQKNGESRWESYMKIRANRQKRINSKKSSGEETNCPVCGAKISGTSEELHRHVDQCLRKQRPSTAAAGSSSPASSEENISVVDESFEEYEWAGQKRIRATSLLEGGFVGFPASRYNGCDDDQQDLNVDGDDSITYGNAQYTEADVIPCASDDPEEDRKRKVLREALVSGESPAVRITSATNKWEDTPATADEAPESNSPSKKEIEAKAQEAVASAPVCLICMESYTTPLVSISCWHVHCEECWLRTLGAKKLCPKCNLITSPRDLRRIYL